MSVSSDSKSIERAGQVGDWKPDDHSARSLENASAFVTASIKIRRRPLPQRAYSAAVAGKFKLGHYRAAYRLRDANGTGSFEPYLAKGLPNIEKIKSPTQWITYSQPLKSCS
jgi:hypothetical protein